MAKNIFSMFQGYVPKPKRNVFDLSFNNNFTTKFGQLTPVLCKEVIPGDSFKIETAAGLRLMPMAFPVQTPMKAYVHYFYVRNRALWKDWQDFITGTKSGLVPPYIGFNSSEQKQEFFKVGGIADYFGVPNVIYNGENFDSDEQSLNDYNMPSVEPGTGDNDTVQYVSIPNHYSHYVALVGAFKDVAYPSLIPAVAVTQPNISTAGVHGQPPVNFDKAGNPSLDIVPDALNGDLGNIIGLSADDLVIPFSAGGNIQANATSFQTLFDETESNNYCFAMKVYDGVCPNFPSSFKFSYSINTNIGRGWDLPVYLNTDTPTTANKTSNPFGNGINTFNPDCPSTSTKRFYFLFVDDNGNVMGYTQRDVELTYSLTDNIVKYSGEIDTPTWNIEGQTASRLLVFTHQSYRYGYNTRSALSFSSLWTFNDTIETSIGISGNIQSISDIDDTPYDNDILLNALPFRAYECIYNSYYRNMQNNPYILNGVEEYNKFIPSNEGGEDTNEYVLHQRNWEYDFMTSAVPSPQFGIAPLVGITMTGTATFQDDNGTTYYAQAEYDDDGTITGWSTHSSNMPAGTLRMLMDSVGTGISINDLRNVNSFQRFLENSLRVGLKYRDQIKGHFGVEVRYDELEMPEFIGGMSLDINVNQVTQTADVAESSYPLAGFAGQAGAFGSSKHSVTKYCDEHGFIIGILSVVPVPVYSQLLPKFFTKNEQLDYFFPEFGHVGYQPILQKEVSPLQSYYSNSDLNNVFGYQRAWYDYIASTDEVHAQFRTTLRDFVMNRTFANVPALNEAFLLVDPDQVNDVFLSTTDGEYSGDSDKILGQLYFKITKKSPIPMLGIPRLTD